MQQGPGAEMAGTGEVTGGGEVAGRDEVAGRAEVAELEGLAEEAGRMVTVLLASAAHVEEHRVALSRHALVWWQGEAAQAYQRRVHDRVTALATLAARLEELAARWAVFEDAVESAVDVAVEEATGVGLGLGAWR